MTGDLGKDKIGRLILRLALPAMFAQFVNVLYGIVDRIFISNIADIGGAALAGVGVCAPILTLITSFCFLVGLGGAPLFAMNLGAQKPEDAKKILANSFFMLLALSVVLTVIFFFIKTPLLRLFGASPNTIGFADEYMSVYILGTGFSLISLGLNSFIMAQGYSKVSMMTVLIGAVINIVFDPVFIFIFNMGVGGAALVTVLSQGVSCLWVILFLLSKKSGVKLSLKNIKGKTCLKIILLGLSPFLIIATDSVVIILLNTSLSHYGGAQMGDTLITAATIVLTFMQIVTMPMGGITMGCQPIISFNYGANNTERVKKAFIGVNIICLVFTSIMFILSMTLSPFFVRIFTSDPSVQSIAIFGTRVYTAGIIMLGVQYACVDSLTALGAAGIAITLSFTRKLVIMVALIILLPMFLGATGVFFAEPIADAASCIISGTVCLVMLKKILRKPALKVLNG